MTRLIIYFLSAAYSTCGQGIEIPIGYSQDWTSFQLALGDQVDHYQVFMDGEVHTVASNKPRHFQLFRYLYENHGVRHFVQEIPFEFGYYVSKYIQTGDSTWLRFFKLPSKEFGEFIGELANFNQSLPIQERIKFISIDGYGFRTAKSFIANLLLDKGPPPDQIKEALRRLSSIERTDVKGFGLDVRGKDKAAIMTILAEVRQNVTNHEGIYRSYFKDDFEYFQMLVFNHASEKRSDENLARNFFAFSERNPGKYYIQYGNLHAQLKGKWLANIINEREPFKDKVCSFGAQYYNSEYWFVTYKKEESFGVTDSKDAIAQMIAKAVGGCTLFHSNEIKNGLESSFTYLFFLKDQKAEEVYDSQP